MKENKLVIAAAGAGKTTFLVEEALKCQDRVLVTTFTIENEKEIRNKFVKACGCIPGHVTIQTWFSFLLQHGVKPYQGVCDPRLFVIDIKGILLVSEQSGRKGYNQEQKCYIYYKEEGEFMHHYFSSDMKLYTDKLAKFVFRANEKSEGRVIKRISKIFPNIFIDEIQDLAGYDLDILKLLFKSESTILCVGDPRQITYLTHWEKKNRKYQCGQIKAFVNDECIKHRNLDKIVIDEELLSRSHRNNSLICEFSSKLYPQYNATKTCDCDGCHPKDIEHQGVFLVKQKDLNEYMRLYHPVQLRNSRLVKVDERHRAYNYGQSKGMTCDRVIIYPTGPIVTWLKDHDSELMPTSRADLYVAVTRARFSVAFVIPDEVCEEIRDLPVWVNEINHNGV